MELFLDLYNLTHTHASTLVSECDPYYKFSLGCVLHRPWCYK